MEEKKIEKSTFTILNDEGKEIECEVLFTFDSDETKKSYIVYTDNTTDESGNMKVYANIFDPTGNDKTLIPIEDEKEWLVIENILSKLQDEMNSEAASENNTAI